MCGRFSLAIPVEVLADLFEASREGIPEQPPRYNVAPSQPVLAVRQPAPEAARELALLRWGLIPSWAKDPAMGGRMINARAETVAEKAAFRGPFRRRRCLVPADGFYEWRQAAGRKQPYYFRPREGGVFAFAGLWDSWTDPSGATVPTCTILTTDANDLVGAVHPRMPVILAPGDIGLWLDPKVDARDRLEPLLRPWPPDAMVGHPVSRRVNSPANDDPACVAPLP